jgi:hypothetical protein
LGGRVADQAPWHDPGRDRSAGRPFLRFKGVAVTATSALIGLTAAMKDPRVVLVALFPIVACWGLDAFYLRRERMFRAMHDIERQRPGESSFEMRPERFAGSINGVFATIRSLSLIGLYLPILAAVLIIALCFGGLK